MPDTIPFECKRCKTRWERQASELDAPDLEVNRDMEVKRYVYRDACPACGTLTVVEATVKGGGDA